MGCGKAGVYRTDAMGQVPHATVCNLQSRMCVTTPHQVPRAPQFTGDTVRHRELRKLGLSHRTKT